MMHKKPRVFSDFMVLDKYKAQLNALAQAKRPTILTHDLRNALATVGCNMSRADEYFLVEGKTAQELGPLFEMVDFMVSEQKDALYIPRKPYYVVDFHAKGVHPKGMMDYRDEFLLDGPRRLSERQEPMPSGCLIALPKPLFQALKEHTDDYGIAFPRNGRMK